LLNKLNNQVKIKKPETVRNGFFIIFLMPEAKLSVELASNSEFVASIEFLQKVEF
jgi:hypothetical protein